MTIGSIYGTSVFVFTLKKNYEDELVALVLLVEENLLEETGVHEIIAKVIGENGHEQVFSIQARRPWMTAPLSWHYKLEKETLWRTSSAPSIISKIVRFAKSE